MPKILLELSEQEAAALRGILRVAQEIAWSDPEHGLNDLLGGDQSLVRKVNEAMRANKETKLWK
jgi:hypothetical protein